MEFLHAGQIVFVDLAAFGQLLRATVGHFAQEQFVDTVESIGFHNAQLVVQVQTETLEFIVNDLLCAFVAHDAFTGEDLHVNDGAL